MIVKHLFSTQVIKKHTVKKKNVKGQERKYMKVSLPSGPCYPVPLPGVKGRHRCFSELTLSKGKSCHLLFCQDRHFGRSARGREGGPIQGQAPGRECGYLGVGWGVKQINKYNKDNGNKVSHRWRREINTRKGRKPK